MIITRKNYAVSIDEKNPDNKSNTMIAISKGIVPSGIKEKSSRKIYLFIII